MVALLYIEVNAFAIFVLIILIYNVITSVDKQHTQRLFVVALSTQVIFYTLDIFWAIAQSGMCSISPRGNFAISALYFIVSGWCGYAWFIYSESVQQSRIATNEAIKVVTMIPTLVLAVLTLASYHTHWIMYIDDNNQYHRGEYYIVQVVIAYGYVVFATIKSFVKAMQKKNYVHRKKYLTLSSIMVIPTIACILQIFQKDMPLLCVGLTLAMINVYINSQEQLISVDPLTQLNNRNQLIKYLSNKIKRSDKSLYLLIMDLDYFKKINDRFGHIEGDNALVCVSNALKLVCGKEHHFIARYGGDEFIVVCEDVELQDIEELCVRINQKLLELNPNGNYTLRLSIGYAKYNDKDLSIPEFIAHADEELYKVKQARKPL